LQAAIDAAAQGCEELERLYRKGARSVEDLKEVRAAAQIELGLA
jgi:hypothetical protein